MAWYGWLILGWLGFNVLVVVAGVIFANGEEKRKNICDMEGVELDGVGWHEEHEDVEILSHPHPVEFEICE